MLYEAELEEICKAQRNRFRCTCGHLDKEHYPVGMGHMYRRCKHYPEFCACTALEARSAFPRNYDASYNGGEGI